MRVYQSISSVLRIFFLRLVTWLRQKIKILQNKHNSPRGDVSMEQCCVEILWLNPWTGHLPPFRFVSDFEDIFAWFLATINTKNTSNCFSSHRCDFFANTWNRRKGQNWLSPVSIRSRVFKDLKNNDRLSHFPTAFHVLWGLHGDSPPHPQTHHFTMSILSPLLLLSLFLMCLNVVFLACLFFFTFLSAV